MSLRAQRVLSVLGFVAAAWGAGACGGATTEVEDDGGRAVLAEARETLEACMLPEPCDWYGGYAPEPEAWESTACILEELEAGRPFKAETGVVFDGGEIEGCDVVHAFYVGASDSIYHWQQYCPEGEPPAYALNRCERRTQEAYQACLEELDSSDGPAVPCSEFFTSWADGCVVATNATCP